MFTGLIREIAQASLKNSNLLEISAVYKPNIGDSIAVNGACLTVVKKSNNSFFVELSHESKKVIEINNLNAKVHIEPAMKLSDRIEGHIIQGHIDCKGIIVKIQKSENNYDFYITVPKEYIKFIIPKGSIAVDGVSLTINEVFSDSFRLTIIPHTVKNTLFNDYRLNKVVNIETDMFARYIYHIFKAKKSLSWNEVDNLMAKW